MNIELSDIENASLYWYFSITENEWHLSHDEMQQLLGEPNRDLFLEWKKEKKGSLSEDTITRLSYLYRIWKILNALFRKETLLEWLRNPNKADLFNNKSPLKYMLSCKTEEFSKIIDYFSDPES